MTDAPGTPLRLPQLVSGRRRWWFVLLVLIALGEVLAQVAAAGALKLLLVGITEGTQAITMLTVTGLAAALFAWWREITGERVGLDYINQVRNALARQALTVVGSGGPGRFGTIAIRMTGDLTALKDWAHLGVCGGLAGMLGLGGAIWAAWWTAGAAGLIATLAGPVLALFIGLVLFLPLKARIRERRRHKGQLSAAIGDMLLGASASAAYGAERRAIRPIDRRGEKVKSAQLRQVALTALLKLPAMLTLPFGAAIAVYLSGFGLSPTGGIAGWAALLFSLSLASLACAHLSGALQQWAERRIASGKLTELCDLANRITPAAPQGEHRLGTGKGLPLCVNGTRLLAPGEQITVSRPAAQAWLPEVLEGNHDVQIGDQKASDVHTPDWARRVAYAGPARGLVRQRLDLVLAGRRRAARSQINEAMALVGLPGEWIGENPLIDPHSPDFDEWTLARLRLVRALAHQPRILIIDDAWLTEDEALMQRIRIWCRNRSVSLIVIAETYAAGIDREVS